MIYLGRAEFAAQRRTVLDEAEHELTPAVIRALEHYGQHHWWNPVLDKASALFDITYREEAGGAGGSTERSRMLRDLRSSLTKTAEPKEKVTAAVIVRYVATAVVNAATEAAASADPETLVLEWVTMHDSHVRETHQKADGQRRPLGAPFHVGGVEMRHPGDTSAPIEEWIGCRCVLRPDLAEGASLVASVDEKKTKHSVVVALPHPDDPVHGLGPEQSHVTLAYLGDNPDALDGEALNREVAQVAASAQPFTDKVSGRGELGDDKAQVLLMDGENASKVRHSLLDQPNVMAAHDAAKQHPNFTPHLTLGYPGDGEISPENPQQIQFDRLAVWHGDTQTEHPLGAEMTAPTETTEPDKKPAQASGLIPWHGVLTVEGTDSGDKRSFSNNSLRNRDLPLPLTWQKVVAKGHDGAVKVARMDGLTRVPLDENTSEIRAHGVFLNNAEADEVIGEMAMFPRVGVSVDLDDTTMEVDEANSKIEFTDARICSASIVIIPAFDKAWVALGEAPEGFMGATEAPAEEPVAASGQVESLGRGPGWVTNPADTKRLHDYWTVPGQPGYEKIAWGTDGDFYRCRAMIGEEIGESSPEKLRFINQQCAQWHFDATGFWPGKAPLERAAGEETEQMVSLVASVSTLPSAWIPKREWFLNPNLTEPTPLTLEDHPEGTRVYGHLAEWNACHLDFPGVCVTPPALDDGGAEFMLGRVQTDDGVIFTGPLTLGGGHADDKLGLHAAKEHYDDATTTVADLVVGPDEFGIWFSGFLHPDVTPAQRYALTSHQVSGDWREKMGSMPLIAAHVVNTPGFGIKPKVHTRDGYQTALVAAGGLRPRNPEVEILNIEGNMFTAATGSDPAELVAQGIEMYEQRKEARARITAAVEQVGATPQARINRLRETVKE